MLAQFLTAFVGAPQSDVVHDIGVVIAGPGGAAVIERLPADAVPTVERGLLFALPLLTGLLPKRGRTASVTMLDQELVMRENGELRRSERRVLARRTVRLAPS
jgi:hypothetical protein